MIILCLLALQVKFTLTVIIKQPRTEWRSIGYILMIKSEIYFEFNLQKPVE